MGNIIVRGEKPEEASVAAEILRLAFGNDAQARLVETLRHTSGFQKELSLVADLEGRLLGYALYFRTVVEGRNSGNGGAHPAALLVTFGVRPECQRQGVGERLIRHGLERCRGLGVELVFASALPEYFGRIGFLPARAHGLEPEGKVPAFLALDMSGGLLGTIRGLVRFPPPLK